MPPPERADPSLPICRSALDLPRQSSLLRRERLPGIRVDLCERSVPFDHGALVPVILIQDGSEDAEVSSDGETNRFAGCRHGSAAADREGEQWIGVPEVQVRDDG